MLHLKTLGTLAVEGPDGPAGGAAAQPKALALLAVLASAGPRGMARERLASYLWPEDAAEKVTHRLTQLLYSLRRDLQQDGLFLGTATLRLNGDVLASDLGVFRSALEAGDFALAVGWYGGPFLDGFYLKDAPEFERWCGVERDRLADRYLAALTALTEGAERRGDLAAAAGWLKRLVEADPIDVAAVERYAGLLEASGDSPGALRFVRSHHAMLQAEFDLEPDPRIAALADRLACLPAIQAPPLAPVVAVLPFANLTPDQENQYFGAGMTEELTSALGRVPGLRVVSRLSAERFRDPGLDPCAVAGELGASMLVCGSVRKVGNRIRLAAQLVDGRNGQQRWAETWERTLQDVFTLQEELCRAIVAGLPINSDPGSTPLVRPATARVDAYTLYLRGRYAAHRRSPEGLALGAEYFEQAVEQDPRYALAHAGLAECLALQGFPEFGPVPPRLVMPRARACAQEAVRLNPLLPEAHLWLGVVSFLYDWDWEQAKAAFRRALQLKRDAAYAQTWYGIFLSAMGQHEEALRHVLYGEALEPAAPQVRLSVVRAQFWAGQFEASLESALELHRADPASILVSIWLHRVFAALGRNEEGLAILEQVPGGEQSAYVQGCMAAALAAAGRQEEARRRCETLHPLVAAAPGAAMSGLTRAYFLLGDLPSSRALLQAAAEHRHGMLVWLAVDPYYTCMRGDPVFESLLATLALPGPTPPAE